MEIRFEMLFGYLVILSHPQRHDVPTHVHADVCPRTVFHPFYHRSVVQLSANYCCEPLHIFLRCISFVVHTWHLVNTSTRMQLLSP